MSESHDSIASHVLLRTQLEKLGFVVRDYRIDTQHFVEYTNPAGKVWLTRTQHFSYPLNHGAVMEMADNKTLTHQWMTQFPVALAASRTLNDDEEITSDEIRRLLAQHGKLVVKPESSSASHGVTLDIEDETTLREAITNARAVDQFSENIIIQEQVSGDEIRFTVLDGKVLAILQRQPAQVIGDGHKTIGELIDEENGKRAQLNETSMVAYPRIEDIKDRLSVDEAQVPRSGEVIPLATSTMISGGASVYNVTDQVHPSYIQFVEGVIARLGAAFLVVDLFAKDFKSPMTNENVYFNEFNKAPALKMFYSCRNGADYDILTPLANAIERRMN